MKLFNMRFLLTSFFILLWHVPRAAAVEELKAPTIQLNDISLVAMTFDAVHIALDLEVDNVNATDIIVEEIRYQLLLNHTNVKQGLIQQLEHFPKHTKRAVRVPVTLTYDKNLSAILAALNGTTSPYYEISGTITLRGEREPLPFSHKDTFILPRLVSRMEKNSVTDTASGIDRSASSHSVTFSPSGNR